MERWLHQHIFKVGWLLTRNFGYTTVIYYTLFIPGVLLHEIVVWLVAGVLNVHATQSIAWPQSQEIGELRLNFVRVATNIPRWKRFVITLSPLVAGMLLTWHIAENVFRLDEVFSMMSSGALADVGAAFERLLATPDFWLWFYLLFAVSNTMFASLERDLNNARSLFSFVAVVVVAILVVGTVSATFSYVEAPFENALAVMSELLVVLIGVNFFMTILLGTLETGIERFSEYTVTFRGGRMEIAPRDQLHVERERARSRTTQRTARPRPEPKPTITSIYKLSFPVPGAPSRETSDQLKLNIPSAAVNERPSVISRSAKSSANVVRPAPVPTAELPVVASLPLPPSDPTPPEEAAPPPPDESAIEAYAVEAVDQPVAADSTEAVPADKTTIVDEESSTSEDEQPAADVSDSPAAIDVEDAPVAENEADETEEPTTAAVPSEDEQPLSAPDSDSAIINEDVAGEEAAADNPPASDEPSDPTAIISEGVDDGTSEESEAPSARPPLSPFFTKPSFGSRTGGLTSVGDNAERPARFGVAPFVKRPIPPADEQLPSTSTELPDPFAEHTPAKPATPRNPLYARLSTGTIPFAPLRSAPVPPRSLFKKDAPTSPSAEPSNELSYEADEEYHSDDDDERTSTDD